VNGTGWWEAVDVEPIVGWRVWALARNRLFSIANDISWRPGENHAECLSGHTRDIPAPSCHGFWALHNPAAAMQLARHTCGSPLGVLDPHREVAVGLIQGYGTIAMHGSEGFRAELARVVCIFSDAPEPVAPDAAGLRRAVAKVYGVPCVALEAAVSFGLLRELGVRGRAVEQLAAWMAAGRPTQLAPTQMEVAQLKTFITYWPHELTQREWEIARLLAQGWTNNQIGHRLKIAGSTVDRYMYQLVEKAAQRVVG
jgi:Bacterial regulatory proteins, luxR family